MPTMADAVNYLNLPSGMAAYAGYMDGPESQWPAAGWVKYPSAMPISVLANSVAMAFDVEPGNASPAKVSAAVAERKAKSLPSVVYVDKDTLAKLSVDWLEASRWPAPGAYLWAAAPGSKVGTPPSWCPVKPVAVQDRYPGPYDLSTLYTGWLPVIAPAPPPPPLTKEELMGASIAVAPDGTVHIAAVGTGNTRTKHLLYVAAPAGGTPPSVIDITQDVANIPTSGKPFTVAP
jgi:hypothetical protein